MMPKIDEEPESELTCAGVAARRWHCSLQVVLDPVASKGRRVGPRPVELPRKPRAKRQQAGATAKKKPV